MKKDQLSAAIERMIAAQKNLYGGDAYLYATANLQGALLGCSDALSDFMMDSLIDTFNSRAKQVEQEAIIKAFNHEVPVV